MPACLWHMPRQRTCFQRRRVQPCVVQGARRVHPRCQAYAYAYPGCPPTAKDSRLSERFLRRLTGHHMHWLALWSVLRPLGNRKLLQESCLRACTDSIQCGNTFMSCSFGCNKAFGQCNF